MPLRTRIMRDGEVLDVGGWTLFHIAAIAMASSFEAGSEPLTGPDVLYEGNDFSNYPEEPLPIHKAIATLASGYPALSKTPLDNGAYTLTSKHWFVNPDNGDELILLPGDVLHAYRI